MSAVICNTKHRGCLDHVGTSRNHSENVIMDFFFHSDVIASGQFLYLISI